MSARRKDQPRSTFVRLPADLREQVDRAAAAGFRPMGLEIEMRLRRSFQHADVPARVTPRKPAAGTAAPSTTTP